jgi:tetratricopeptide (TPR) repeat protein
MIHLRNYGRAIDDLNTAIRHNPSYSAAFLSRGVAYGLRGEHDRAIADFTDAIRLDPRNVAAYTNRGVAYTKKGEKKAQAEADFDVARKLTGR